MTITRILLGTIIAVGLIGCTVRGEGGLSPDAPSISITSDDACQELLDNPVRAKDRFTQSRVIITGVVTKVSDNQGDGYIRVLMGYTRCILFIFPDTAENREKVSKLTSRGIATIEGVYLKPSDINKLNANIGSAQRAFDFEGLEVQ